MRAMFIFFFFWFGEGLMETMRGIKNDALIISNNWQTLTRIAVFTEGFLKKTIWKSTNFEKNFKFDNST